MLPWNSKDKPLSVAIIGDLILDEYLDGSVERISPEAPVAIHKVSRSFHQAGGAANAARNIQALGAQAHLFGCIGDDEAARVIGQVLSRHGIGQTGVLTVEDRPTIKKTRITSGTQQMLRIDWESVRPIGQKYQDALIKRLEEASFAALLISDYGKGALPAPLLKRLFTLAKTRNVPTVVDPKGTDFFRYVGCDLITPNLKEAYAALGMEPAADESLDAKSLGTKLGRLLQERFGLNDVLVTMGAQGMVYCPLDSAQTFYGHAKAREVYDVSGAGDAVAAVMTLALACSEVSVERAVQFATAAGTKVVEKWGTQPIERAELEEALALADLRPSSSLAKILSEDAMLTKIDQLRSAGKKVVFTNGCFDLLHVGHLNYLEGAKALGDVLVLAVNSDRSIRELKGPTRPVVPLEERLRMLASLASVDYVFSFDDASVQRTIEKLLPDILVKGGDYTIDQVVGAQAVMRNGGVVKTLGLVENKSSTALIEKIRQLEN